MNVLPAEVLRTLQIADRNLKAPAPSVKLRGPGWKSVCSGAQVFRKSLRQLFRKYATKKGAGKRPFRWFRECRIRGKF
jgi:hypothetical protein